MILWTVSNVDHRNPVRTEGDSSAFLRGEFGLLHQSVGRGSWEFDDDTMVSNLVP